MTAGGFRFSEHFGVEPGGDNSWYDALLHTDTKLFVDPFRVYDDNTGVWKGAHAELIDFFNLVLELLAQASLNPRSQHWHAASDLLMFPEPVEFCLGYAEGSGGGRGTARKRRDEMLQAASIAIDAGMEQVEHFEEMALFQGHIGPDLVSDITCNVLKNRFIEYTHAICERHDVPKETVAVRHAAWSREHRRWVNSRVDLPYNPWTGAGILLTPEDFLRRLPAVQGEGFWEYAFAYEADQIRGQFQYDVARNVDAKKIADLARRNPDLVRRYVARFEDNVPDPYDLDRDPRGLSNWYDAGLELATLPGDVTEPKTAAGFCRFVGTLCDEFAWAVEERGGWRLLWNPDGTPRAESAVQQLFHIAMLGYAKAHNIDLSPEASSGRGPVDFKFSQGWERRALVELKLANNTNFWHGLNTQVSVYMNSEGIRCGYFMAVQYSDRDLAKGRIARVRKKATDLSDAFGYTIKPVFVDARPKKSASKA